MSTTQHHYTIAGRPVRLTVTREEDGPRRVFYVEVPSPTPIGWRELGSTDDPAGVLALILDAAAGD